MIMKEILMWVATYAAIIFGGLFLFNFMSNGFLFAFIKTKMKRGKQVLVIVHGKLDSYSSKGFVEGSRFKYYDRETKKDSRNKIPKFIDFEPGRPSPISRLFGVPVVQVDETAKKFILPELDEVAGTFDPIQQEQFIIRALQKPTDSRLGLLLLILIGVVVIALIAAGFSFMAYNVGKANAAQLSQIGQYMTLTLNQTMQVVPGVV